MSKNNVYPFHLVIEGGDLTQEFDLFAKNNHHARRESRHLVREFKEHAGGNVNAEYHYTQAHTPAGKMKYIMSELNGDT